MRTWIAILFTVGLLAASVVISRIIAYDLTSIMILGTALWAGIDSSKLNLKSYKSGIAHGPVVLFFVCALLWIVGFPWYLAIRYKIKNGTAVLMEGTLDVVQPARSRTTPTGP
ncbi:MAG: hypothetical protein JNN07_00585 [Verrucomicrobiales bacterium]|nr:hypothetical protein [Verrucomicrobiales bacterium]